MLIHFERVARMELNESEYATLVAALLLLQCNGLATPAEKDGARAIVDRLRAALAEFETGN